LIEVLILFAKFYLTTGLILGVLAWGTLYLEDFKEFVQQMYPDDEPLNLWDNLVVVAYAVFLWPPMLYEIAKQMRK
jgi:hypothetical protein